MIQPHAIPQPVLHPSVVHGIAGDQLLQYFERIERLEEEKTAIADDIKAVFLDAKSNGFDVKTMREILKIRKLERAALEEQETMIHLYREAIGMH
ncbi:MAG: DUF2312 domain-containing protein [Magnetococcales bacterium]|nr:DUF2312 domain-containing protein [Magnetococcales bacterium]